MSPAEFRATLLKTIPPERIERVLEELKAAGAVTPALQRAIERAKEKPTKRVLKINGKTQHE
jgi:hypothetical protein